VVSVLGYRVVSKNNAPPADTAVTATIPEPAATVTPTAAAVAEPAAAASAAEPAAAASAAEPAAAASATASTAEPAPAASASAAKPTLSPAASAAAPATDIRRVTVKSKPPKVRFFHFGKPVGVTPFVLEFKPGERHAYEAGLPGYGTRKVVIDGSKPVVIVGLTREKP